MIQFDTGVLLKQDAGEITEVVPNFGRFTREVNIKVEWPEFDGQCRARQRAARLPDCRLRKARITAVPAILS